MRNTAFKVGDIITIERSFNSKSGYRYTLIGLMGGAALIEEKMQANNNIPGCNVTQIFRFQFLQPGNAEIQFISYRPHDEMVLEDTLVYKVYPFEAEHDTTGLWSHYRPLLDSDKCLFDNCIYYLIGAKYIPSSVSVQELNGKNYRFECSYIPLTKKSRVGYAIIEINVPLKGAPTIVRISSTIID